MSLYPDTLSSSSGLYCAEDATSWVVDDEYDDSHITALWSPDPYHTGSTTAALLAAEADHLPSPNYLPGSIDPITRTHAVTWILKVNEFYSFRPVTAYLAVSYLDRFLSASSLPSEKAAGWAMQLLSVACLSVAAKMEETFVPLLLDLQILEPRYVFDPRTVRRMELLLMSTLQWRLRSVTPFDFLDHLLPPAHLSRAAAVILRMATVVDSLCYRPSELATAAAEVAGWPAGDGAERVSKDAVTGRCQLMDEFLDDTCRPVGGLDESACGSCLPGSAAEPPRKRRRITGSRCADLS